MTTAGLDQIAESYQQAPAAQIAAAASLEILLGKLTAHYDGARRKAERLAQAADIYPFPAQQYAVTNGAPVPPTFIADAHAPKDGYVWFVTRVSVDGLVASGGAPASGQGQATSPGSGATIASIAAASITPGTYMINWTVGLAGTPSATDTDNFRLRLGSTALATSSNPGAGGQWAQPPFGPILLNGASSVNIITVAAGTAGAVYDAGISLAPVPDDIVTLYRGPGIGQAAQGQNRIHTFSAPGTSPGPDWVPGGKGLPLKHQDTLVLGGSGLAAAQLILSGDVVALESWLVPDYII